MGLELRRATPNIHYNWYTYVPPSLERGEPAYIWVAGLHDNIKTDDYDRVTRASRQLIEEGQALARLAERYRLVLLVPVIPRPPTLCGLPRGRGGDVVYLTRDAFRPDVAPICRRPDLTLNLMIDALTRELRAGGYRVADRVFINGFSAGSMFAQRYVLLHPNRVQAAAAGQCGGALTLPEARYGATRLYWPAGLYDVRALTGGGFDREAYRQVPQLIFIGDRDTEHTTVRDPGVWPTWFQIRFLHSTFGETDPARLRNQVEYLRTIGYPNIAFRLYPGMGHTVRPVLGDILAFLDAHREQG